MVEILTRVCKDKNLQNWNGFGVECDKYLKENISRALKQVKQLKNELKRKIKMRKENFFVIIPKNVELKDLITEGEAKFVAFERISEEIDKLANFQLRH